MTRAEEELLAALSYEAELQQLRAENERLQRHAKSIIDAMTAENERLRDHIEQLNDDLITAVADNARLRQQRDALVAQTTEPIK
jgi:cell division protein FtsB